MGRIMAIDYGLKRCGIAVTDPLKIIATGLATVYTQELLSFISEYFQREKLDAVVVGLPVDMKNRPSDITKQIEEFIKKIEKKYPALKIVRVDERFTSYLAQRTMIESGLKKKARRNKALIDEISATIILQSYLEIMDKKA